MALFWRSGSRTSSTKTQQEAAPPAYRLVGAMLSHPGKVRSNNEDTVAFSLPQGNDGEYPGDALLLVADGMGGHAAGEVASRIAADVLYRCFFAAAGRPIDEVLAECFHQANAEIFDTGQQNPEYAGMGTTCTAIAVRNNCAWLGHVGDSRAYLLRDDTFHQISEDHTLVAELVRRGSLTQEEAAHSPERNVILKALGTTATVAPKIWDEGMALRPDDRLLLCSDGLSDLVTDATMHQLIAAHSPLEACQALIDAALEAGGHDNVSVGVFHLSDRIEADDLADTVIERPTRRPDETPDIDDTVSDRPTRRTDAAPVPDGAT
jgi:PPM family protein phosphatase